VRIIFDAVTKQFGPVSTALADVSFVIDPAELVLITGPSGSGKTTLMRLLIREYTPESGEVYWGDQALGELRSGQVPYHRRQIGVVFQDYKLLPELNIWENIALPLSIIGKDQAETESRVTDLLKLVSLEDKAYAFPSQLSGGEAQRVSIARALATGPSVIFADEPTGNLDPVASLEIVRLLRQINKLGTTVILATHDSVVLEFLKGERRLALEKGKLEKDSAPKPIPQRAMDDALDVASDEAVEDEKTQDDEETEDEVADALITDVESLDEADTSPKKAEKTEKPEKPTIHITHTGKSAAKATPKPSLKKDKSKKTAEKAS